MNESNKSQTDAMGRSRENFSRRSPSYMPNSFQSGYNNTNIKISPSNDVKNMRHARQDENRVNRADEHEALSEQNRIDTQSEKNLSQKSSDPENIFNLLFADKERTLIILLIALLNEEKTDPALMLALMYLIID